MNASWRLNATTFVDKNTIGQQSIGIFINEQDVIYAADREHHRILVWLHGSLISTIDISRNITNLWSLFVAGKGDIYMNK